MNKELIEKKKSEALAYYEMKRYGQAEQVFKEILASDPENYSVLHLLANCYFMLDQYDEAENTCKMLIPTYLGENAFRLLGMICRHKKEYKRSEEFFLKSLELNPQSPNTMAEYAYLLLLCGYNKKAVRVMNEAVKISPDNSKVLHYKFYFKHSHGSKKEEVEAIEQYVANSSDEVLKLIKMGQKEYKNKRFKEARELFRQAFVLEPTNNYILTTLNDLDRINHFLFFPKRLNTQLNPAIRFLVIPLTIILITYMLTLLSYKVAFIFLDVYIIFVVIFTVWSWLSLPIYKCFIKNK